MDKETLSNYGWIVICVLVLAVMIALATPFGSFVADAVKSTTQGLFDVNQSALNSTGLINIDGQSFGEGGNGATEKNVYYGDVDMDGDIDNDDATTTNKIINGDIQIDRASEQWDRADVNGDGSISMQDTSLILQYINGSIDKFPVEETTQEPETPAEPDEPAVEYTNWEFKEWNIGLQGDEIWTDGTNVYRGLSYVLNGDTWEKTTFNNAPSHFEVENIWTDGINTYHSVFDSSAAWSNEHHVLVGNTWVEKEWNGFVYINGSNVWTDGTNIYYSGTKGYVPKHYVLNGDTWEEKTWEGLREFYGAFMWSDGTNTYYTGHGYNRVLVGNTWVEKEWNGLTPEYGDYIWTDGVNIYYSYGSDHYVLQGDTWVEKTWTGLTLYGYDFTDFYAENVWTDGTNVYHSNGSYQYVLVKK